MNSTLKIGSLIELLSTAIWNPDFYGVRLIVEEGTGTGYTRDRRLCTLVTEPLRHRGDHYEEYVTGHQHEFNLRPGSYIVKAPKPKRNKV